VLTFGRVVPARPYLYWMLVLYWTTLIALIIAFARSIRSAPMSAAAKQ
jgi:hypothetical protein